MSEIKNKKSYGNCRFQKPKDINIESDGENEQRVGNTTELRNLKRIIVTYKRCIPRNRFHK